MQGIAAITIGGQRVGLKFGMPALRQIFEKMKQYPMVVGTKSNDIGIAHILFAGYLNFCIMKDEAPVHTFEYFYDYVETIGDAEGSLDEITDALKAFEDSRFVKPIVANDKKKVTETKETATTTDHSTGTESKASVTAISVIPPPITAD